MAKRVVLHYGGEKFVLPESQADALDDLDPDGSTGVLKLNLDNGKWLSIVYGPGIPIALTEEPPMRPPALP